MHHVSEHRLIRYIKATTAPVNRRAAQTASAAQNANAATKGTRNGSNEFADRVESTVQVNYQPAGTWGPNELTPEQQRANDAGMRLADATRFTTAPGYNPAKGTTSAQQQTYANQDAGLNTSYNPGTGVTQTAGQGELESAAIQNMRDAGKTDDEIRAILSSPEYTQNIQQTMSNTGLPGTDRQSAVLTPAQAQQILSTSRNPKQRAEAQKVIDDQVGQVKGYDQIPQYNENGQLVGYQNVENAGKTQENQQRERERLALEESNRLKSAENADKLKKFTAGIDTTALDQTKTQLDEAMSMIKGLSPDLQAVALPQILDIQRGNNDIEKQVNEMIAAQPTDEEIEGQYDSVEDYILEQDTKYKALLEKNQATQLEIAKYNQDALKIEKQIIDHDADVAEQRQMVANAEGEKKLRRQLNRLGIQTDVSGLGYLQSEIQKGVSALDDLKRGNDLVSLKAQLAIGEGYRLEVKQAMETYEGNYLNITAQTTEKIQGIKNSISLAKSERTKAIIEARKWGLEQKNANDKEARATIADAQKTMNENLNQKRDDDRAKETLGWSILNTAIDNYGSTVPQSILDRVKDMLPQGTDIQDIISAPTLAQEKITGGSGGIGGIQFSPSERKSNGQPLGFEEFVAQRKAEIKLQPNLSLEDVKRATDMKLLRAEYDAKSSQHSQLDPNQLLYRLADRTKNSAKHIRESAEETVKGYLQKGEYQEADLFVDGLGTPLSAGERGDMIQALNARKNVLRIQSLLEEFGQQGPVTGRLKDANLWSVKQAELNGLVTQTVPGLARGIFKEVGVLTDQDIERYTKTIPNSKNTIEQSQALTNQLLETINMSIENQLAVLRDSGLNTRDLRTRFETLDSDNSPSSAPLDPSQKAWLDSL